MLIPAHGALLGGCLVAFPNRKAGRPPFLETRRLVRPDGDQFAADLLGAGGFGTEHAGLVRGLPGLERPGGGAGRDGDRRQIGEGLVQLLGDHHRDQAAAVFSPLEGIEQIVLEALKRLASDRTRLRPMLARAGFHGLQIDQLSEAGGAAAIKLERLSVPQLSLALKALLQRVEVTSDRVFVTIRLNAFAEFILWDEIGLFTAYDIQSGCETRIHLEEIPANLLRERRKGWLPVAPRMSGSTACPRLTRLLQDAREAQASIYAHRELSLSELAQSSKRKAASFSRLVRLNYLAPDIVAAIVDGTQPPTLTRQQLMDCELPMDWALQRRLLGFPAQQEAWNRKARE